MRFLLFFLAIAVAVVLTATITVHVITSSTLEKMQPQTGEQTSSTTTQGINPKSAPTRTTVNDSTSIPAGFRGPTSQPHVVGPTSQPPNY